MAETLAKFSEGDTGSYVVKDTRGTVNGNDGVIITRITPVKAIPGAGASAGPKQQGYKVYDYTEAYHKFRLVVPDGLAVVRGLLVVRPYAGGDSRDYHRQAWYREFLHLHGFAFLGAKDFYLHDYKVLQNALKRLATGSKHPELVHAPYAAAMGGRRRRCRARSSDLLILLFKQGASPNQATRPLIHPPGTRAGRTAG